MAALPPATYQWFKKGAPISGATQATLKLTNLRAADAGRYTVKTMNRSGSATSEAAVLTVR